MNSVFERHPSPALLVALVALFVALGGTSYGIATGSTGSDQIKDNSVRSKDIRNNQVRGKDVRAGTIRSSDVGDAALLARDFAPGQLPRGEKGDQGPKGEPGERGLPGPPGADGKPGATNVTFRSGPPATGFTAGSSKSADVHCESGEHALGGGGETYGHNSYNDVKMVASRPDSGPAPGWKVIIVSSVTDADAQLKAYVVCASP